MGPIRKTKIICTIGPACESESMLRDMMLAGMNVARLNFSHGTHEEHKKKIDMIKKLREELSLPVAIMLDTKGPEIRTGKLKNGPVTLTEGDTFTLVTGDVLGDNTQVSVTLDTLPQFLSNDACILLDDGLIELRVQSVLPDKVICAVVNSGVLGEHKGINLPGTHIDMVYLNERDQADILFGLENDIDFIALSFVRSAQDVRDVRHFIDHNGSNGVFLIAKIENAEGVDNIDDIISHSNGIMVARGDMGVEIPFEELPHIQKEIIRACHRTGKMVITATQMLESMIQKPRPTRAEITDVANAIYDGTSAIMLSGETASGKYPLEALKTMSKIAVKTESCIDYRSRMAKERDTYSLSANVTNAISHATCTTAHDLGAAAIVAVTRTGSSARMISRFRPATAIVAVTPNSKTFCQLALSWGITPVMNDYREDPLDLFPDALTKVVACGLAKDGDLIVVTGSSQRTVGTTNTLQVHIIGDILLKGIGNGLGSATGRLCVFGEGRQDTDAFVQGDVLVLSRTTNEILHICRQASAIITEEEPDSSGAASAGLALGIPVIAGAVNAVHSLKSGSYVRIDAMHGFVYNSEG